MNRDPTHYSSVFGFIISSMKRIVAAIVLPAALLLASVALAEQTVMEVIPLKHRSSDEIIPLIRPFLDQQGALSGMQGQLIIRTTPGNLQEIKRLLDNIDTAPRRLIITVRQNVDRATERRLRELSVSAGTAGTRVTISGSDGDSDQVIAGRQKDGSAKARVLSSRSLEGDRNTQQVHVLEGSRALIRIGQLLPLPARVMIYAPQGVLVTENTQYRDATTGFTVLARVNGEQVTLEVSPQRDTPSMQSPGSINT